jgi:hypothetical protein
MLRPRMSLAVGLLLCVGLAGCSGNGTEQVEPPTASPTSSKTDGLEGYDRSDTRAAEVSDRDETPAPDQRLRRGDLAVPANAVVIFAPFTGHGDRRLSFDPRRKNFSLVFSCEGEGRFSLVSGPNLGGQEPCRRGLPLHLTVATDGSPQQLRIRTTPDTTWRMVAIEGDGLGPDVKPVH